MLYFRPVYLASSWRIYRGPVHFTFAIIQTICSYFHLSFYPRCKISYISRSYVGHIRHETSLLFHHQRQPFQNSHPATWSCVSTPLSWHWSKHESPSFIITIPKALPPRHILILISIRIKIFDEANVIVHQHRDDLYVIRSIAYLRFYIRIIVHISHTKDSFAFNNTWDT